MKIKHCSRSLQAVTEAVCHGHIVRVWLVSDRSLCRNQRIHSDRDRHSLIRIIITMPIVETKNHAQFQTRQVSRFLTHSWKGNSSAEFVSWRRPIRLLATIHLLLPGFDLCTACRTCSRLRIVFDTSSIYFLLLANFLQIRVHSGTSSKCYCSL